MTTIYVKPVEYSNGRTLWYLGDKPSDASRGHCDNLGGYFLICRSLSEATAVATSEGRAWAARNGDPAPYPVVVCPSYAVDYGYHGG